MSEAIMPETAINDCSHEQEWTPAKAVYTGLMAFNLVSFVWLLATGSGIPMHPVVWFARLATVPLAIGLGKLWKDRGFRILAAYTLLFFIRCFIPNPEGIFHREMAENILSALWLFAGCYGLGRILNIRQLRSFLLICSGIWIIGVSVCACVGIYAAWTGTRIASAGDGDGYFGLYKARLRIIYLSTTSGSILGITVLICAIILICIQSRIWKTLLTLAVLPIILALALTDSRTAYISVPAGFGVMAFSGVFHLFQKKTIDAPLRTKSWKRWIISILIMFLVFVILILAIMQITPFYNRIRHGGGVISAAYAEEGKKTVKDIANRGFTGDNVLNGRWSLWSKVINYLYNHPLALLIGESKLKPTRGFNNRFAHCHSLYLQVLLEGGVPGLLLLLSFVFFFAVCAVRAIRNSELPLWIRLLPALPTSLLVGDIAECLSWLRSSQCPMNAILFISAGILCALTATPKARLSNETTFYRQEGSLAIHE